MMEASETFLKVRLILKNINQKKALSLIQDEKWNNADIVFITDGIYNLSDECKSMLKKSQSKHKFSILHRYSS